MEQIENLPKLQDTLYKKGFPEELMEQIVERALAGETEFSVECPMTITKKDKDEKVIFEDEMMYKLHFRADEEKQSVYLNSFDAALLSHKDGVREQTNISSNTLITAQEAHRMLKYGKLVAVNKNLYNKEGAKYNVWLSFDVSAPKVEGNYPVLSYHQNYYKKHPFDVQQALKELHVPVVDLENPHKYGDYEAQFKKANIITVTIDHNNERQTGYLCINTEAGKVDVYDKNKELIERPEGQQVKTGNVVKEPKNRPAEDVKKKPWQQGQNQNMSQKGQQRKGMGM